VLQIYDDTEQHNFIRENINDLNILWIIKGPNLYQLGFSSIIMLYFYWYKAITRYPIGGNMSHFYLNVTFSPDF